MKFLLPFETIAGNSLGAHERDTACELPAYLDRMMNTGEYPNSIMEAAERIWKEIAACPDDELDLDYWSSDFEDAVSDYLPASCLLTWEDNEYRVLPFIDDENEKLNEQPDLTIRRNEDVFYVVNERGNVDCYEWQEYHNTGEKAYRLIWSMV